MNADSPVGQNLNVVDLHSLFVRRADDAAHETLFELDWVRRHTKSSVCRAVEWALLLKGERRDGCRYGTEDYLAQWAGISAKLINASKSLK